MKDNAIGDLLGRSAKPSGRIPSPAELDAYNAPFPGEEYKAGVIAFPELVPTPPSDPTGRPQSIGGEENKKAWEELDQLAIPVLTAFSDGDMIMQGGEAIWKERVPGCKGQPHTIVTGQAGHFLQETHGEELASIIIEWVKGESK